MSPVTATANVEIGGNLLTLGIALVTLGTLIVNSYFNRKAAIAASAAAVDSKTAAEQATHASSQLRNNGGSTALDKLEKGQEKILEVLSAQHDRLNRVEVAIAAASTPPAHVTPLPPPPPVPSSPE